MSAARAPTAVISEGMAGGLAMQTVAASPTEPKFGEATAPKMRVISAAPQVRDKKEELRKLMPSSLRVRREAHRGATLPAPEAALGPPAKRLRTGEEEPALPGARPVKDMAYDRFMQEMDGLI